MPNWCSNKLTVRHDDPQKLQEFVDAYNAGRMCEHFHPQPSTLATGEELTLPNGQTIQTMSDAEWHWRVANWGTKWDISPPHPAEIEFGEVTAGFDSAWSPPFGVYDAMVEQGYTVHALYFEPGCDFCGAYENHEDENWSCHDEDVPDEIREAFDFASFYSGDED